jgi:membrane-associated phospholipid phosphatase
MTQYNTFCPLVLTGPSPLNCQILGRGLVERVVIVASILLTFAIPCTASQVQESFPYELDQRLDGLLSAGGVALLSGAFAVRRGQEPLTAGDVAQLDPADVNGFDRSATSRWSATAADVSDAVVLTFIAAPLGLAIATTGSRQSWTVAAMYGEAMLVGNALGELLKRATSRTRPFAYNLDVPDEAKFELDARRSFPSGHTTNAFAAAVFLSSVFGKLHPGSSARTWMWAGSLSLATTTGYMRYRAGKHFPTDIISGAIIGSLAGWGVPKLHKVEGVNLTIAPSGDGTAFGLVLRH